jgi:hypothetical protein
MSSDNNQQKGLMVTKFIVSNIFWFVVFSFIYLTFDVSNWWLIKNPWGRFLLVLLELTIIQNSFFKRKK